MNNRDEKYNELTNVNFKQVSAKRLMDMKAESYYVYDPPLQHHLVLILAMLSTSLAFVLTSVSFNKFGFVGIFPAYHTTQFYIIEAFLFIYPIFAIPYWWRADNKARQNWRKMENFRSKIDHELSVR